MTPTHRTLVQTSDLQTSRLPMSSLRMSSWAILAAAIAFAAPARAQTYDQNYPVCLQVYDDMVHYYFECAYTSIPQCQASASGRAADCVVNPYYVKPQPGPVRHRKRKHA